MFRLQFIGFIGLVVIFPAWASGAKAASGALPASSSSLPHIRQRPNQDQVEVHRLQQDVVRQESDSQRASRRLQQQDQAITGLRRQLRELQARPAADHHLEETPW